MKNQQRPLFKIIIAGWVFGPALASANLVGNDTQNFNPITSGVDFVTVQSSETLDAGIANLGVFLNSARNVLPDTVDANGLRLNSDDSLSAVDLNMGYGLLSNFELGLNVSYLVGQETHREEPGAQFAETGLNEIRGSTKWRILPRDPLGLALVVSSNLNQVRNNPFLGVSPGPTTNVEIAMDTTFWNSVQALNVGYRFRDPGPAIEGSLYSPLGPQVTASLAFSHYFPKWDFKLISELFGAIPVSPQPDQEPGFSSEFLLGGKYDWSDLLSMHAGLSRRVTEGLFSPDLRIYAGFNFSLEVLKKKVTFINQEPTKKAPQTTQVYSGYQPGEIQSLKTESFDEIEKHHEFVLRRGIPTDLSATKKPPFEIFRLIDFDFPFGSSEIQKKHEPFLKDLVRYLNSEPRVLKVRIEGHTDSIGTEERNAARSASRALAVKDYLLRHGLGSEIQIESIGYGSVKPIADNSNFQGRQQNRRVEARILREIERSEKIIIHDPE